MEASDDGGGKPTATGYVGSDAFSAGSESSHENAPLHIHPDPNESEVQADTSVAPSSNTT